MNHQLTKRLLNIGILIFWLLTITFGILSIININDCLFRILSQGFFWISVLFSGILDIAYKNKKTLGYFSIGASIILFCVMFSTIYATFKIGTF